jgi:hypothetical protein
MSKSFFIILDGLVLLFQKGNELFDALSKQALRFQGFAGISKLRGIQ